MKNVLLTIDDATKEWVVCGGGAGRCSDTQHLTQSDCENAAESWIPYVWDEGYPGLQQNVPSDATARGSLNDAYKCDTGTVDAPTDLRSINRGNCYAQYSMLYTFSWTYGALPHFDPKYIGCPLCDNELIIKGFKEDTDADGAADTYQINTKIPVSLANTGGLAENGRATNEIDLPGIDLIQVSAAALLEPDMLQKFSFVFAAVEDPVNRLRVRKYPTSGDEQYLNPKPTSLDEHIDLYSLFTTRSYEKVVPFVGSDANHRCGYTEGVCVESDDNTKKVAGRHTEFDCLETSGECKDAGNGGASASNPQTKTECEALSDCGSDPVNDPKPCQWFPDNAWLGKDSGAGPLVCQKADTETNGVVTQAIRCDLSRNLCIQEDAVAGDANNPELNVFEYTIDDVTYFGCPDLFKNVCEDGNDADLTKCDPAHNLKLFRLSADPAASLQELFESNCKMYVPTNGYGSTYYVEFENDYESSLGTCVFDLVVAGGNTDAGQLTVENVPAAKCSVANHGQQLYNALLPAGKAFKSTKPSHTLNNREEDQKVISTIKELKAGRFLRLEQTQLSLMQRLEVTQVFQRVATTVNFKISKNTVTNADERVIFKIRGGSATLDGFTANDPATQLSDECALGPKGHCTKISGSTTTASTEWEHLCGYCCASIGVDSTCNNQQLNYKTKLQCELRGHQWLAGLFQPSQPDVSTGFAWKRHTIREYECDDANRDESGETPVPDPL